MESYFNDVQFRVVAHRFIIYGDPRPFSPICNSLEFISKGQIMLEEDGKEIKLSAPVLFWMKKGGRYRFYFTEKSAKTCEHIFFDYSGERSERIMDWLQKDCPEGCLKPVDPAEVNGIFYEMLKNYRNDPKKHHAKIVFELEKLLFMIHESLKLAPGAADDPYEIYRTAEIIRSNPFLDFDFREIAARNDISYDHFRRLFRQQHKMPPWAYIRNQRLFRAAELLRVSNMRIKEVMYACRFDSLMEFSRSFKRYSGFSPRIYRTKMRDEKNSE